MEPEIFFFPMEKNMVICAVRLSVKESRGKETYFDLETIDLGKSA